MVSFAAAPPAESTNIAQPNDTGIMCQGGRHESGGERDSTAKRLISERTCTQGPRAFVGQDGMLRPIGNRPSDAFGRRLANPPQDAILPDIASEIPRICRAPHV